MCRIAIGGPGWTRRELADIFAFLEMSNGGDGNGIWADGHVRKGVSLKAKDAAKSASRAKKLWVFHTRKKSIGKVDHESVHPIKVGKNSYIVQNGTWSMWRSYQDGVKGGKKATTDTQLVAAAIAEKGIGVLASGSLDRGGVFVYMSGSDYVHVFKRTTRPLVFIKTKSGRWMYVSEDIRDLIDEPAVLVDIPENSQFIVAQNGWPIINEVKPVHLTYSAASYNYGVHSGSCEYGGACGTTYAYGMEADPYDADEAVYGSLIYEWLKVVNRSIHNEDDRMAIEFILDAAGDDWHSLDENTCSICPANGDEEACTACPLLVKEVD